MLVVGEDSHRDHQRERGGEPADRATVAKPVAPHRGQRSLQRGVRKTAGQQQLRVPRHQIEMPIASEMYRVLYEGASVKSALQRLMTRSLKAETDL